MYSDYDAIASVYDTINSEIDYISWADFFESCFKKYLTEKPTLILDLACGTGRMTFELHKRGYDMIGADASEEMLYKAYDKAYDNEISDILFIKQDMRDFELYGTVGAVTCCLDSINYLTTQAGLKKCFSLIHNYLDPNGIFIFDINTPYKFENIYSDRHYILEADGIYCGWQNYFDKKSSICDFDLTFFIENENGSYFRRSESQRQRCWQIKTISNELEKAGFDIIGIYSDLKNNELTDISERAFFVCRAIK